MGTYALVAALPIVAVMVFLVLLRWPAVKAMPVAYFITLVLALTLWKVPWFRSLPRRFAEPSSPELCFGSSSGLLFYYSPCARAGLLKPSRHAFWASPRTGAFRPS